MLRRSFFGAAVACAALIAGVEAAEAATPARIVSQSTEFRVRPDLLTQLEARLAKRPTPPCFFPKMRPVYINQLTYTTAYSDGSRAACVSTTVEFATIGFPPYLSQRWTQPQHSRFVSVDGCTAEEAATKADADMLDFFDTCLVLLDQVVGELPKYRFVTPAEYVDWYHERLHAIFQEAVSLDEVEPFRIIAVPG